MEVILHEKSRMPTILRYPVSGKVSEMLTTFERYQVMISFRISFVIILDRLIKVLVFFSGATGGRQDLETASS
jgi:hypothetical protein